MKKLDEELKYQVLFEDENREPGMKDKHIYEEIRQFEFKKEEMPNLFRWAQFMKKFAET